MVVQEMVCTILTRKRIIYQFSRMVASCKRLGRSQFPTQYLCDPTKTGEICVNRKR